MNVESIVAGMDKSQMLDAMEIIWQKLSADSDSLPSPDWHQKVLEDRLANSTGESLSLEAAKSEIKDRLNARRTSS